MIQPAAAGSVVKVFTEGLDWSGDDATPPASKKATDAATTIEDAAEAQGLLKDALKNLPKGF